MKRLYIVIINAYARVRSHIKSHINPGPPPVTHTISSFKIKPRASYFISIYFHPDINSNTFYSGLIAAISINYSERWKVRVLCKIRHVMWNPQIWAGETKLHNTSFLRPPFDSLSCADTLGLCHRSAPTDCQYRDEDLALAGRGRLPPSVSEVHQPPTTPPLLSIKSLSSR